MNVTLPPATGNSAGLAVTSSSSAPRRDNVSRSDERLYGELAPVVRQLGIAAAAAQDAYELASELSLRSQVLLSATDEGPPPGKVVATPTSTALMALTACSDAHRLVASMALEQADMMRPRMGSSRPFPPLTRETLTDAVMHNPMRGRGLLLVVAEDLRATVEDIYVQWEHTHPPTLAIRDEVGWTVRLTMMPGEWMLAVD